ncbi:hypothetical protein GWK47_052871 [Chionoecetes opilio]|uniref:Uncharacterized protein n=1 Tax=Chionoecetes opilio TaxID=41210 RepID=A0A8J4Y7L5_CHIOP|nr:hypothetical protein GWK47_052871 [Chionoecetes opilio]
MTGKKKGAASLLVRHCEAAGHTQPIHKVNAFTVEVDVVAMNTQQIRTPDSDDPTGTSHPRRSLLDAILGELGTPRDTDSQLLDRSLEDDLEVNVRGEASEDDLPDYDNDLDDFSEEQMYSGHRRSGSVLSSESEMPPLPLTSPPHTPAFPTDEEEEITEYDNEVRPPQKIFPLNFPKNIPLFLVAFFSALFFDILNSLYLLFIFFYFYYLFIYFFLLFFFFTSSPSKFLPFNFP